MFGADYIPFHALPEIVNRYLTTPDPVVIHYIINPAIAPPEKPAAYDVEMKMEDVGLKARMTGVTVGVSRESTRELAKLDDEVCAT